MVSYNFFPFSTAPAPYDIVWSNFPLIEEPSLPAPKPRPALVRQAFQDQDGQPWVTVVPGTSKSIYRQGLMNFLVATLPEMQACGLGQATRFKLDQELELPWSREFFQCLPGKPTPIIGHMPAYEVRKLQIQIAYLQNLTAQLHEDEEVDVPEED